MQGDSKVIELLNQILTNELAAINQYFIHAKMCENWGFNVLFSKMRAESIDEMKHADEIISRILYLEGIPNLARVGPFSVGQSVPEMFKLDLEVEKQALAYLNKAAETCRDCGDLGTFDIVIKILRDEEEHADWIETQLEAVERIGAENYLAQQL